MSSVGAAPRAAQIALLALCAAPLGARAAQPDSPRACGESAAADPLLASTLSKLGEGRYYDISVSGLARVSEPVLWKLMSARGPDLRVLLAQRGVDAAAMAVVLVRLAQSGLFARIALEPAGGDRLSLSLAENPFIARARVSGLAETPAAALLGQFVGTPTEIVGTQTIDDSRVEPASSLSFRVWRKRMDAPIDDGACALAPPEPTLFASVEAGALRPGILRGGLTAGRARALAFLRERGYPHASIEASLDDAGALLIEANEGRLRSFEVRGVAPALVPEVLRALALEPGDIFSGVALRKAVARLSARYPYIELDPSRGGTLAPAAEDTRGALDQLKSARVDLGDLELRWDYRQTGEHSASDDDERRTSAGAAVEVLGPGQIVLWLRERRFSADIDWIQLIRHTPATGFAPGLAGSAHLWDPLDRAHISIDGDIAINTKRAARDIPSNSELFEKFSAQEELDALLGARLAVPALHLAELGGQLYALTDTNDTWRMSDTNSYIHSALLATPDRDYFRRAGATALATFQLFDQLTLGGEYHIDRYDPLPNPRVWSLIDDNDVNPSPAAPVTPGRFGSLLVRGEWSSDPVPLLRVGKIFRHPETSLAEQASESGPTFHTLATLEVGARALGSDPGVDYLHILSDSRLQLAFPHEFWMRLRFRAGAGNGLPLQKDEALGGWSALRGYDFKEFRGDSSLLGNIEARWHFLGSFIDLGAVHEPIGWTRALPSIGAQLFLYRIGSLEVAWRLDGNGNVVPSARALLGWDL